MSFDPLMHNMTHQDFIGVKIGDVNNSAANLNSGNIEVRSDDALILVVEDRLLKSGETIEIPISVLNYSGLAGYQFTLHFNPAAAVFQNISFPSNSVLNPDWFGLQHADQGFISHVWHEPYSRSMEPGAHLFSIGLRATMDIMLSEILSIERDILYPEAYGLDEDRIRAVRLGIGGETEDRDFAVFQNLPNPFSEGTIIPVQIPQAATVVLEVYAYDGRLVHRQSGFLERGYHEFIVSASDLREYGIYYYTVSTEQYQATRRMILIK
jgi:hypothetical protein